MPEAGLSQRRVSIRTGITRSSVRQVCDPSLRLPSVRVLVAVAAEFRHDVGVRVLSLGLAAKAAEWGLETVPAVWDAASDHILLRRRQG